MSGLTSKDEEKCEQKENIERMEMAHIKMEAVLEVTNRWQITDRQLLQWQRRLKRAAQECDNTLLRCKQQAIEEEQMRQQVSQCSFPKRIAHATKSLISSFTGTSNGNDGSSSCFANVQKFERLANGANEFLKTIQFGGALRRYTFFNPLIRQLLTGKSVRYHASQEDKFYQLNLRPMSSAERGVEAMMGFSCQDFSEPEKGFYVSCMLRLSESTDIFGVIMKCVQAVAPHFNFAAEDIRRGLIQLPTQDFFWDSPYSESEFWVNVHNTMTQWHRPNPLCCSEHRHQTSSSITSNTMASSSRLLSSLFPEEVINMHLKWHVPLSDQGTDSMSLTAVHEGCHSPNLELPALKLGVLLIPHESAEDIEPTVESYALEVIDGKKQGKTHRNADLQDLGVKLLSRAIDYLHHNSESKMYQMSLKSRHGTAHLCVEKATTEIQTAGMVRSEATRRAQNNRETTLQEDRERWKQLSDSLLRLWVVRGSDKLHGAIMDTHNSA